MATSALAIANMALGKIGAKTLVQLTENSLEANAVGNVYNDILLEVLAEHPWSFAQKRVVLTDTLTTPTFTDDGMTTVYSLPTDFVRAFLFSDPNARIKIEYNQILSDTKNLKMVYVFNNTVTMTYLPLFTRALTCRLASEICFALSQSVNKSKALYDEYENIALPRAVHIDSQQSGTPLQAAQNEWINGMRLGSSQLIPSMTPDSAWHPWGLW